MRKKVKVLVIGAGAGGLGAASWLKFYNQDFMVVDTNKELPLNMHNGVHYLHEIPDIPFGFGFKSMTLTDGILIDGHIEHCPNLKHALEYSEKVREIQHPSSIMDIGKRTEVFMTKSNSINELLEKMHDYSDHDNFQFGYKLDSINVNNKTACFVDSMAKKHFVDYSEIISTIPLDRLVDMLPPDDYPEFAYTPIYVTNYKVDKIVPNWMINLYLPSPHTPVYRASILNGICSVESIRALNQQELYTTKLLLQMFHLTMDEPTSYEWKTGKIISISQDKRVKITEQMSHYSIQLVGRFALWDRKLLVHSTIDGAKMAVEKIMKKI